MKRLILIPLLFLWAQAAMAASPTIVDPGRGCYKSLAVFETAISPRRRRHS